MLKQSNEEDDLSAGTFGFLQGKGSEGWQEVLEVASNLWHKTRNV